MTDRAALLPETLDLLSLRAVSLWKETEDSSRLARAMSAALRARPAEG